MSFVLVDASIKLQSITPGQRLVLAGIASYADKSGKCWPSVATIAERLNMGVRSVNRHITSLVNLGLLVRIYRAGRSAVTRITDLVLAGLPPMATSAKLADLPLPNWPTESVTGTCQQTTAPSSRSAVPIDAGTATAAIVVFDSIKPEASQPDAVHDLPVNLGDAETLPRPCQGDAVHDHLPEASQPDAVAVVHDAVERPEAVNDLPVNAPRENLLGLDADLLHDFGVVRKAKKKAATVTKTEAVVFASEAQRAGLTPAQAVRECVLRGWTRFEAAWLPAAKPLEVRTAVYRPEVQQVVRPEVVSAAKAAMSATLARLRATPTDPLASAKKIIADHDAGVHVNAARLAYARAALRI